MSVAVDQTKRHCAHTSTKQIFQSNWSESQWTYPPTPGANGFVDAVSHYTGPSLSQEGNFGAPPYNLSDPFYSSQMEPFPQRFLSRLSTFNPGEQKYWWMGKMANGSQIAPGNYTYVSIAFLRVASVVKKTKTNLFRLASPTVCAWLLPSRLQTSPRRMGGRSGEERSRCCH